MSTPTPVTTAATGAARWYRRRPAAWVHPGFRRLALAWVFTNLADSALYLMVAVWVKEITGSDGAAALVFALLGVPAFVAPFLGTVADRVSRRRLLVGAYTGIALVVASLFLVQSAAWLALLYAVVVAYGAVGYLTAAAQSGLLRDLLPDEHLASGNGLLSTIDQSLRLVSPVLGAGLYALVGPRAVVALTVVSFALAGLVLLTVRVRESEPEAASERGSYRVELSAGVRHLARTPVLGRVVLLMALACGAVGMVNAAVFPALEQGMGLPPSALGVLVSFQGVGAVAAGMTVAWAIGRWGERRTFAVGTLALGVGILPVMGSSVPLLVVGLVVVGAGVTWSVVAAQTLRIRLTPPRLQGRTGAAANMAVNVPQTVTTAAAAAVLGVTDYRLLVAVTAAVVGLAALGAVGGRRQESDVAPAVVG
ncbi:MAG TPA: MFS transporter [Ornithinicoccus sp.]|jgi:MFS family permease|nr:MFS transporter [Ornithinicoccus sp.]